MITRSSWAAAALCCLVLSMGLPAGGCQNSRERARKELDSDIGRRKQSARESAKLYRKGMKAYEKAELDDARRDLREAVEANRQNFAAWMALGVVEYETDNFLEAAKAFEQAKLLMPGRYEPYFNLGAVFETVEHYSNAIEAYERALELAPDRPEVMENLARTYIRSGREPDRALALVRQALAIEFRPDWRYWLKAQENELTRPREQPTATQPTGSHAPTTAPANAPAGGREESP